MTGIDELGEDAKTVPELVEDTEEVLVWAKEIGARIGGGNWVQNTIGKMKKILAEPSKTERDKRIKKLYDDPIEGQNNISDMVHLGFMRRHIGDQDASVLKQKLTLALKGANSVRQETIGNTKSRDARFELSMCARLNERGYKAKLDEPNPDICATRKKIKAAIECKRVFSGQSVERQILEGWRQLRDRPGSNNADLRVIFCDVTRAFTEGQKHLQGNTEEVLKELEIKLHEVGMDVIKLLGKNCAAEIDAVVLTYQDYIEPKGGGYTLRGITQYLVVINAGQWPNGRPVVPRKRRRLALRFFSKLSRKGIVSYEDI